MARRDMADTTMPATEAKTAETPEQEVYSYEFAFHILPTVAEEEVPNVFAALKTYITTELNGELLSEETPERIELAYDIVKSVEGKRKRYERAYFGWVRFTAAPEMIAHLSEYAGENSSLLRHIVIKLTKTEEAHPFRYHEKRRADKMVEVLDEDSDVLADPLSGSGNTDSDTKTENKTTDEKTDKTQEHTQEKTKEENDAGDEETSSNDVEEK